jgi:hypothetical protein
MRHTLGTAAKACGVGRSTILRAIKSGRISADKDDTGNYAIDPAELHRVFPPVAQERTENQEVGRDATEGGTAETAVLKAKIQGLEALLKREQDAVEDLRRRLDFADEERRRLTVLLTHQTSETRPTAPLDTSLPRNGESGRLLEKLFRRRQGPE